MTTESARYAANLAHAQQWARELYAAADNRDELARLYVQHVGYNPFEDFEDMTIEEVFETLEEFLREFCISCDVEFSSLS